MEMFDQPMKMMEQCNAVWREMLDNSLWGQKKEVPFREFWTSWIAGIRSANEVGVSSWKLMLDHGEDLFFKALKDSRIYSQTVETQLQESWAAARKAHSARQEALEDLLTRMESILAKQGDGVQ